MSGFSEYSFSSFTPFLIGSFKSASYRRLRQSFVLHVTYPLWRLERRMGYRALINPSAKHLHSMIPDIPNHGISTQIALGPGLHKNRPAYLNELRVSCIRHRFQRAASLILLSDLGSTSLNRNELLCNRL